MVEIRFIKCRPEAKLPSQNAHNLTADPLMRDSGYDIYSCEKKIVRAHNYDTFNTGLKLDYITPGYWFRMESKSGLMIRHGNLAFPGVIDCAYRGTIFLGMFNVGCDDYPVEVGDRIAQMVIYPLVVAEIKWNDVDDVGIKTLESHRGENGIGSSGR